MTVIPLSNHEATFSISDGSLEFQDTLSDLSSYSLMNNSFVHIFKSETS